MTIDFFSDRVRGLDISGNDFEFFLSARALIVLATIALVVIVLRRIKKVRGR